jgi:hypothetical protein
MKAHVLIRKISKWEGPIFVEVSNGRDVHSVHAVKADVLAFLKRSYLPKEETYYTLLERGLFCRDVWAFDEEKDQERDE